MSGFHVKEGATGALRYWHVKCGQRVFETVFSAEQAETFRRVADSVLGSGRWIDPAFPEVDKLGDYMAGTRKRLPGRKARFGVGFVGVPTVRDRKGPIGWHVSLDPEDVRFFCHRTGQRWEARLIKGEPWMFFGRNGRLVAVIDPRPVDSRLVLRAVAAGLDAGREGQQ